MANTQYQSACTTPDIQHFVPVSTQSSPSRTALVRMPTTSLPACGSESPKPARSSPVATPRTYCCFCSSLPAISTGPVGSRVSSSMSAAVFEYFATSSIASVRPRIPAPDPPYSSGTTSPSRPVSRNSSKRSCGYVGGGVDLAGPGRDLLLRDLADGGLQLGELGREVELHRRQSLRDDVQTLRFVATERTYPALRRCRTMRRRSLAV